MERLVETLDGTAVEIVEVEDDEDITCTWTGPASTSVNRYTNGRPLTPPAPTSARPCRKHTPAIPERTTTAL